MSLTPVEPLQWQPDGSPFSPRFGDVYRSRSGGLAQALHVFANGCGLPLAWRGRARWDVLETGFGLGLNFLATWALWRSDPVRSPHLRFVSVEAYPVDASALLRSAEALKPHPSTSAAPPEGTRPPPAWDADLIPLVQALAPCLQNASAGVYVGGAEQGLHLCLRLPARIDDLALAQRLGQQGLIVRPLSAYCLHREDLRGLVIGYGYAPLSAIERYGPVVARAVLAAL